MERKPNKARVPSQISVDQVLNRVRNGTQTVFDTCCSECDYALEWLAKNKAIAKNQHGKIVIAS